MEKGKQIAIGDCHFCGCEVTFANEAKEARTLRMRIERKLFGVPDCPPVCEECAAIQIKFHEIAVPAFAR